MNKLKIKQIKRPKKMVLIREITEDLIKLPYHWVIFFNKISNLLVLRLEKNKEIVGKHKN